MTQTIQKAGSAIEKAKRIDEIALGAMALFEQAGSFEAEIQVAQAMVDLRAALTDDVMRPIMALMNTDVGFQTDKNPERARSGEQIKPYSVEVVRDCFIEARLRGFHAVGNEWNIISGRFYGCKNGLRRKVREHPGVTDVKDTYEVPRLVGEKGAIVKCKCTWRKDGKEDSVEREFPIKVNSFMGSDAILGKAERKLFKAVFERLSGRSMPDGDVDDAVEVQEAKPEPEKPRFSSGQQQEKGSVPMDFLSTKPEAVTPQTELAAFLDENRIAYGALQEWATREEFFPNADSFGSVAELPTEVCKKLLQAKRGLLAQLKGPTQ